MDWLGWSCRAPGYFGPWEALVGVPESGFRQGLPLRPGEMGFQVKEGRSAEGKGLCLQIQVRSAVTVPETMMNVPEPAGRPTQSPARVIYDG